jgi:flavin reductase (DIM6/NTAB) family NADH-FMN oxidoreductase RutF
MTEPPTQDTDGRYYYEPALGHGLPHDPFNAIVGPRPIGWVSTRGADGSVNLAPYSFFNAFCYRPPIIGFSSMNGKDSLRNAEETGEFVWNMVTHAVAAQMNATSASVSYGIDELALAGLTPLPARHVNAYRVGESPVHFECKVTQIVRLQTKTGAGAENTMVFGEVVAVHIDRALLKDGIFDTFAADIVLRGGGPSAYARIEPHSRFDMRRPS